MKFIEKKVNLKNNTKISELLNLFVSNLVILLILNKIFTSQIKYLVELKILLVNLKRNSYNQPKKYATKSIEASAVATTKTLKQGY